MAAVPSRRTCGYEPFELFSCVPLNFQHFESLIRAWPLEGVAIKYNICIIEPYQNHNANIIPNYAKVTKGFTRLLKQNAQFSWDEIAQKSFDALKHALTHAPLLHPPNYNQDYFLYLAASHSTIGMVLVQEGESGTEHVIYYLSQTLNPTELKYSHVEK